MTLKSNRAPLQCYFKLCASFHNHMCIQTGVTVRKRLSWLVTSVTLTFDLWPWPFVWTLLLSLVITPENFMMIRWWEHSQKGVTDRQTDRRKIPFVELLGRSSSTLWSAWWSFKQQIHMLQQKMVAVWNSRFVKQSSDLKISSTPLRCHWKPNCQLVNGGLSLVAVLLITNIHGSVAFPVLLPIDVENPHHYWNVVYR